MSRFPVAALLALLLLVPGIASAAPPTTTTVVTPAGPFVGPVAWTGSAWPMTLSGSSDGTSGAVDVYCYFLDVNGSQTRTPVALNVAVGAGGTFSAPAANAIPTATAPCTLLAVPQGTTPVSLTPFHGPVLNGALTREYLQAAGPNTGKQYDYYDAIALSRGYMDFDAIGSCGLDYSRPFLPATAGALQQEGPYVLDCTGWYPSNQQVTGPGVYRSGVQIDGRNALPSSTAHGLSTDGAWQGLTHTATFDPVARSLTIVETDKFVECQTDPGTAQLSSANCPPFAADGVSVKRTQVVDHEGGELTQTDEFSSTTGQHALDLSSEEDFSGATHVQQFPGEPALSAHHTKYAAVAIPAQVHPASILDEYNPALADGVAGNPRSSTTMWPVPDKATIGAANGSAYNLHFGALTIPASGTLKLTRVYAQDFGAADLAVLTNQAEDRLEAPQVSLTAPADGATVSTAGVTVTGTASDNKAVASVTVNGQAATLSGGAFSKDITLSEGANTITVVASDATGNTATATRSITYTKPVTPPAIVKPPVIGGTTIACPAGGPACTAIVVWTSSKAYAAAGKRHKVVVARRSLSIPAGTSKKATPKLTTMGARLLRKHRTVRVVRRISARAGTGTPVVKIATATIRRAGKKG